MYAGVTLPFQLAMCQEVYNHLVALLAENVDHILYVEVGQVFSQQVVFGPIDGVQP
jgi:hypothetical protein